MFCPVTKLPPVVVHTKEKPGPQEDVVASSTVSGALQFSWVGEATIALGAGDGDMVILVLAVQKLALLTMTEYVPGVDVTIELVVWPPAHK